MVKTVIASIVLIGVAGGCAHSRPNGEEPETAVMVHYARRSSAFEDGGNLYAKWSTTPEGACSETVHSAIPINKITDKTIVGNCPDFEKIMKCTHR